MSIVSLLFTPNGAAPRYALLHGVHRTARIMRDATSSIK
jgi:hypothetical protein